MPEWICETGIGETRAALVEAGTILEARVSWDDDLWTAGTVTAARYGRIDRARGQAFVILPDDSAAILDPLPPPGVSEGAPCRVEVVREPILERDRRKWPKVRLTEAPEGKAAPLVSQLGAVRLIAPHEPDLLEQAGWSELIEEAATGHVPFAGGALHLSLTPAMTLIDVDGTLPPADLAQAGALAAARTIRRMDIGGSIGIDLPTVPNKAARQAAGAAIDSQLPQPFERTAVNGFGFVQIVRRRQRLSLPERLQADPAGAAARLLLRKGERTGGHGAITLSATPEVIARIAARPDWTDALARRIGRLIHLRPEARHATGNVHAEAEHP